jgi:H+/Cl- antiporter ClcA
MNGILTKELAAELLAIVQGTKSFVLEQAPDIIQQMIRWEVASSILGVSVGLLCIIIVAIVIFRTRHHEDGCMHHPIPGLSVLILSTFSIPLVCINTYNLVFVTYAPKLFIIKELARLIK